MTRVPVANDLLQWAMERSDVSREQLESRFPKLPQWEAGERQPTLKQLEGFAKATRTPVGYFFLSEPPVERVPIPDFRTPGNEFIGRPSANLLDTIYACQQRQEWYREYARTTGDSELPFVGSITRQDDITHTASHIRSQLGFDVEHRRRFRTWTEAIRHFVEQADDLGALVMVSGVVGSNNRRKLDPGEFRGFALVDSLAPVVFINGADTKAGQMFTLAHELAHLWLGESALSDVDPRTNPSHEVERWCNQVAAELLVPRDDIAAAYQPEGELRDELDRLARRYKVSTLVVLRRLYDVGGLSRDRFWSAYDRELARLREISRSLGGDFYLTTAARVSRRFARAVVTAAWEGRTSFTEAFQLVGCRKTSTFEELGRNVGADV